MLIQNGTKNGKLLVGGIALIALRSIVQPLIDKSGHANDITDLALGLLLGIGFGLIGLFVWRLGRGSARPNGAT
jgi:hypothetical protein